MAEMDIRLPETMRRAAQSDWRMIGAITGDAFQNDPVSSWVFGNKRPMAAVFGRMARDIYLPHGICHLAGDDGATQWLLPGVNNTMPLAGQMNIAWHMIRGGGFGSLKRGMSAGSAMARHHPKEPHAYLYTIAVRASAQGRGLGRALLAPMLDACDRAGLPAYLENSNPRNHSFYAGQGFDHIEHFSPGPAAPPLEAMWREPR
ncbi:acetyltransferase (GNAT) family protein [Parasphingopyxis lamellibrachiae]|uniref:Acetyltransferase (GNAT) family protein n=2 Tax=Parasphingopyxis lamellibrachiae TaxID=680125 RepID=A0A3D9FFF1_9SPHN|nr:acetyltransferase (GNAT) family protein [Parasphingopyxis lamellibrachiae]